MDALTYMGSLALSALEVSEFLHPLCQLLMTWYQGPSLSLDLCSGKPFSARTLLSTEGMEFKSPKRDFLNLGDQRSRVYGKFAWE